ncbi:hypothetical protein PINS_up016263 [Pythium insidiosum]|nr:hypothetical protein PINS_up016263 [Pythium insidiosum]
MSDSHARRQHQHHRRHHRGSSNTTPTTDANNSNVRSSSQPLVVGVDVTAHTEERHITDASRTRSKRNFRVRYYVELVVGSPRESHTRLGFSGTFKALLRLHRAFETLFDEHHRLRVVRESVVSTSTSTSLSSASSVSSVDAAAPPVPKILPFPVGSGLAGKLLVKLEPQRAESDEKTRARIDALFAYYTQLFNSEERDLYLQHVQSESEREAAGRRSDLSNQRESELDDEYAAVVVANEEAPSRRRSVGRFFDKLFSRHAVDSRHSLSSQQVESTSSSLKNDRERLDSALEFRAPVYVHKAGSARSRRPF